MSVEDVINVQSERMNIDRGIPDEQQASTESRRVGAAHLHACCVARRAIL